MSISTYVHVDRNKIVAMNELIRSSRRHYTLTAAKALYPHVSGAKASQKQLQTAVVLANKYKYKSKRKFYIKNKYISEHEISVCASKNLYMCKCEHEM